MKKRKPPFLLVTLLVAFVGVAVAMSNKVMTTSGMKEEAPEVVQPDDGHGHDEPVNKTSADEVANAVEDGLATDRKTENGDMPLPNSDKMKQMESNTIMKDDEPMANKPVRSDSDTATQWWDEKK